MCEMKKLHTIRSSWFEKNNVDFFCLGSIDEQKLDALCPRIEGASV
jgi:hypothetical protein